MDKLKHTNTKLHNLATHRVPNLVQEIKKADGVVESESALRESKSSRLVSPSEILLLFCPLQKLVRVFLVVGQVHTSALQYVDG